MDMLLEISQHSNKIDNIGNTLPIFYKFIGNELVNLITDIYKNRQDIFPLLSIKLNFIIKNYALQIQRIFYFSRATDTTAGRI